MWCCFDFISSLLVAILCDRRFGVCGAYDVDSGELVLIGFCFVASGKLPGFMWRF